MSELSAACGWSAVLVICPANVARVPRPRNQRFDRRNTIQIAPTVLLKFHALIVRFKQARTV